MKTIISSIIFFLSALSCMAQVSGSWTGSLNVGEDSSLRLGLNISPTTATLDSPDQGAYGIPMVVNANIGDSVSVSVPQIRLTFTGRLMPDGKLSGRLRQGMLDVQLQLDPKDESTGPERPQTPRPPFPYSTREVTFTNADDGDFLAGTLTIPDVAAPGSPVVLFVSGSGTQDRDETVLDHKPFAVLADALARKGIASLRYDDCGAGKSTGSMENRTTATNTRDAAAGLKWLRDSLPSSRVGVLGHSEGGRIAYALPADFIIGIGAPAFRGDSVLADQNLALLLTAEVPLKIAESYADAFFHVINGADVDAVTGAWQRNQLTEPLIENLHRVKANHNPWLDYFVKDSPAADIAAVKVPMLVIYGDKDTQVTASLNAPEILRLNPATRVEILTGLNHMMQHCTTGAVSEYGVITETMAPEAIDLITTYILSLR